MLFSENDRLPETGIQWTSNIARDVSGTTRLNLCGRLDSSVMEMLFP
jgi:hypothetical protein